MALRCLVGLMAAALAVRAQCIDGPYGVCNASALEPPLCSIDCACDVMRNGSAVFSYLSASCLLGPTKVYGSSVFLWVHSNAYSQGIAALNLSVGGVVLGNQSSTHFAASTSADLTDNATLLNLAVSYTQTNPVSNLGFSIGGMPCVQQANYLFFDGHKINAMWNLNPGSDPQLMSVYILMRNFSKGKDAPWEYLMPTPRSRAMYTHPVANQCAPISLAFGSSLKLFGIPSVNCSQLSLVTNVSLSTPPDGPILLDYDISDNIGNNSAPLYNVSVYWQEGADLGTCTNMTYKFSLMSLNIHQFGSFDTINIAGTPGANHTWIFANCPLLPSVQYVIELEGASAGGSGDPMFSDSFWGPGGGNNPPPDSDASLSVVEIAGIAVGGLVALTVVGLLVWRMRRKPSGYTELEE